MILGAGTANNIKPGEAVVDPRGMIGRIYLAGDHTSWVILLTDLNSRIPVTIASDAVVAGLKAHGIKRKIAIMEPYYPCIEPRLNAVLGAHGYEVVRYCHMRGKSPASYSVLTAQDMIKAARSIDGPDVEAIVAFGANLPFAKLADEAERWLDKPVLQINATTYWHALRSNGIADKVYGYGSLLARF